MRSGGSLFILLWIGAVPLFSAETTIKGGRMELLEKGERVMFKGGVTLERDGDVLKAREMTTNKSRDKVRAEGKVDLFRKLSSTETFQAFGERGQYETATGRGFIEGKKILAHLIHTTNVSSSSVRVVHIYAERIDFSNSDQKALARGAVRGSTTDPESGEVYEFWSEAAEWEGRERKIIFTGTPFPLVKRTAGAAAKTISGERIVYFTNTRKFISEGNAQAVFLEPEGKAVR